MGKAFRLVDGKVVKVEVEGCAACGNTAGTFRVIGGKQYCKGSCSPADENRDAAKSTFPFTTTHLTGDGRAVTVNSLRELRQMENRYGVHAAAYNLDAKNMEK